MQRWTASFPGGCKLITRRELVQASLAGACALGTRRVSGTHPEPSTTHVLLAHPAEDLLAQESRAGFELTMPPNSVRAPRLAAQGSLTRKVIVLPAARNVSSECARRMRIAMEQGAWIIWEHGAGFHSEHAQDDCRALREALGVRLLACVRAVSGNYVHYRWPTRALVRAFHEVAVLDCAAGEIVAEYGGAPIAMKRAYGSGGLVFLGSMLGPGIRAREPEALQVGHALMGC